MSQPSCTVTTWQLCLSVTRAQVEASVEVRTDLPQPESRTPETEVSNYCRDQQRPYPWTSVTTYPHGQSQDACHYRATQAVAGCLSPPYYMDSSRTPVSTHLHGFLQDTCHWTPPQTAPGHLSLYIYIVFPKMPATTHLCGLSHDACHYTSTSLSQDACHSTSAWVCHGRAPFWGSDAQTLNQPTC